MASLLRALPSRLPSRLSPRVGTGQVAWAPAATDWLARLFTRPSLKVWVLLGNSLISRAEAGRVHARTQALAHPPLLTRVAVRCHATVPSWGARVSEKGVGVPLLQRRLQLLPLWSPPWVPRTRLGAPGDQLPMLLLCGVTGALSHPPARRRRRKRRREPIRPRPVFREASKSAPPSQHPCSPPLLLRTLSQPLTGLLPCTLVPSNSPRRSGHAPSCLGALTGSPPPSK